MNRLCSLGIVLLLGTAANAGAGVQQSVSPLPSESTQISTTTTALTTYDSTGVLLGQTLSPATKAVCHYCAFGFRLYCDK